jgi:hypothetical protein
VHLTLGILRTSQAVFYASAFSQSDGFAVPAPAQVTQTVRQPRAKPNTSLICKFRFLLGLEKQVHLLGLVIF